MQTVLCTFWQKNKFIYSCLGKWIQTNFNKRNGRYCIFLSMVSSSGVITFWGTLTHNTVC